MEKMKESAGTGGIQKSSALDKLKWDLVRELHMLNLQCDKLVEEAKANRSRINTVTLMVDNYLRLGSK